MLSEAVLQASFPALSLTVESHYFVDIGGIAFYSAMPLKGYYIVMWNKTAQQMEK